MTPQESSPNPALEARYNSIVTTRVKAGSIVLAHMFVMMSSAVDIRDHERMDHGLAKAFHVITRIGVPIAALGTYAALCPIDFPPDGVVHVTYWFLIWSALCVLNSVLWWRNDDAPRSERHLRALISFGAATILCHLAYRFRVKRGAGIWSDLRISIVLLNATRMLGTIMLRATGPPTAYPPGQMSFVNATLCNVTGLAMAALFTKANRLRLSRATGAATVQLGLSQLTAMEVTAAFGGSSAPSDEPRGDYQHGADARFAAWAASRVETNGSCARRRARADLEERGPVARQEGMAVVLGKRIQCHSPSPSPVPTRSQTSSSWGSYGRAWEADWQHSREKELDNDRQHEMEMEFVGLARPSRSHKSKSSRTSSSGGSRAGSNRSGPSPLGPHRQRQRRHSADDGLLARSPRRPKITISLPLSASIGATAASASLAAQLAELEGKRGTSLPPSFGSTNGDTDDAARSSPALSPQSASVASSNFDSEIARHCLG
jgi:hypothetical protein